MEVKKTAPAFVIYAKDADANRKAFKHGAMQMQRLGEVAVPQFEAACRRMLPPGREEHAPLKIKAAKSERAAAIAELWSGIQQEDAPPWIPYEFHQRAKSAVTRFILLGSEGVTVLADELATSCDVREEDLAKRLRDTGPVLALVKEVRVRNSAADQVRAYLADAKTAFAAYRHASTTDLPSAGSITASDAPSSQA